MRGIFFIIAAINVVVILYFNLQANVEQQVISQDGLVAKHNNLVMVEGGKQQAQAGSFNCRLIENIIEKQTAEQIQARLSSLDISAEIKETSFQETKDYWVYIPPQNSYSEARKKVSELSVKGIDSFIFAEGELKNGISLGIYSKRTNATNVFQNVKMLGYEPKIKESYRDVHEYMIFLNKNNSALYNDAIFNSIAVRFPEIRSQSVACN